MNLAVVIPCFKVKQHIAGVLEKIGPEVKKIYVVDDACPEETGNYVKEFVKDKRIQLIFHSQNQGVGGAVISGYRAALSDGMDVI
ncbi:MAG: hypothetical protein RLZZ122_218, partial [Actinomycetota bacterium]